MFREKNDLFWRWHRLKANINNATARKFYFSDRDIWWASLGVNIGHEEDGKNINFERPVLILKKFNQHLILVIPLSRKVKPDKFYYHQLFFKGAFVSALICQIRLLSSKRLIRKLARLDTLAFICIKQKIRLFFD